MARDGGGGPGLSLLPTSQTISDIISQYNRQNLPTPTPTSKASVNPISLLLLANSGFKKSYSASLCIKITENLWYH